MEWPAAAAAAAAAAAMPLTQDQLTQQQEEEEGEKWSQWGSPREMDARIRNMLNEIFQEEDGLMSEKKKHEHLES